MGLSPKYYRDVQYLSLFRSELHILITFSNLLSSIVTIIFKIVYNFLLSTIGFRQRETFMDRLKENAQCMFTGRVTSYINTETCLAHICSKKHSLGATVKLYPIVCGKVSLATNSSRISECTAINH